MIKMETRWLLWAKYNYTDSGHVLGIFENKELADSVMKNTSYMNPQDTLWIEECPYYYEEQP